MIRKRTRTSYSIHTAAVGNFYDRHGDAFLQVYGDVIQAFRTTDPAKLLHYEATAMGLQQGMRLLDAGCGVCGPAIFFATHYGVQVDALTASGQQALLARQKISEAGLADRITVQQGDYHDPAAFFQPGTYDVVYFLESFGHSRNKGGAIRAAWQMLKPGGLLYIKDLFAKEAVMHAHARMMKENIERINRAYHYEVGDLCRVLADLRRTGFILSSLKTIDIPLEDFENLSISNQFQELTGINRIDDLQTYVFPVDFFEISCIKPWYDPAKGNSRYFLQNLYYLQVLKKPETGL